MKEKRIEEILSAAFGEHKGDLGQLNEAERKELETARLMRQGLASLKDVPEHQLSNERLQAAIVARMTPSERREFEAGLLIQQGLASLKDVPEHQLSNERLRDAILGSTVRKQRKFAPWSLATAGVACLALALIAIQALERPGSSNDVVALNGGGTEPEALQPFSTGENNATAPTGQSDVRRTNNIVSNERPITRRPANPETSPAVELEAEYRDLIDGSVYSNIVRNSDFDGPEVMMQPASLTTDRDPVVVVDSATLNNNGAASAKEVASYGDVVFGG